MFHAIIKLSSTHAVDLCFIYKKKRVLLLIWILSIKPDRNLQTVK